MEPPGPRLSLPFPPRVSRFVCFALLDSLLQRRFVFYTSLSHHSPPLNDHLRVATRASSHERVYRRCTRTPRRTLGFPGASRSCCSSAGLGVVPACWYRTCTCSFQRPAPRTAKKARSPLELGLVWPATATTPSAAPPPPSNSAHRPPLPATLFRPATSGCVAGVERAAVGVFPPRRSIHLPLHHALQVLGGCDKT